MKKLFAILLALTMVLSMSVCAFADDPTGSITITNATVGQDYSVYKVFNATYQEIGDKKAVAYNLDLNNADDKALYDLMFPDGINQFFAFNNGEITKNKGVADTELIAYLTGLAKNGNLKQVGETVKAESATVTFDNLPYGYYVITSTLGTTVTINSNTPDVEVIDKNQQGGTEFSKNIVVNDNGAEELVKSNSACFGETITYQISFNATNYDGAGQTQFYSVYDTTGAAIDPDFDTISVTVNGAKLPDGYYIGTGEYADTSEALGGWDGSNYATAADWYLVRSNENEFRISIPWMSNHTLNGSGDIGYSLSFGEDAESKFDSPAEVVIRYNAVVGNNATIGGASYNTTNSNNINTAHVKWYFHGGTHSTINDTVHTYVYGIGVVKEDSATAANLAGAEFAVYGDADCTVPVKFNATDIKGVYNHYNHDETSAAASNVVVSQANGKIVLLGLEEGDYYLKEIKAPDGYNGLSAPVKVEVGEGKSEDFSVYANGAGEVADTEQDVAGYTKHTFGVTKTTIQNSQGVELPSTGGETAVKLIAIGTVITLAFAVLMITQKKMSVYKD